jgi:hypothetical protein
MDDILFVQHAVRDSQGLAEFMDGLVNGRMTRVSLGADLDLANPELEQTDPTRLAFQPAPADQNEAPRQAQGARDPKAASAATDDASDHPPRSRAADAADVPEDAPAIEARVAPSFAEQLRGGAGRLPMSAARH